MTKKKVFVPDSIRSALSVNYESSRLTSEPDVLLISCPKVEGETDTNSVDDALNLFKEAINNNFESAAVINIQCKTNWNDVAQIPMLWNMIYKLS